MNKNTEVSKMNEVVQSFLNAGGINYNNLTKETLLEELDNYEKRINKSRDSIALKFSISLLFALAAIFMLIFNSNTIFSSKILLLIDSTLLIATTSLFATSLKITNKEKKGIKKIKDTIKNNQNYIIDESINKEKVKTVDDEELYSKLYINIGNETLKDTLEDIKYANIDKFKKLENLKISLNISYSKETNKTLVKIKKSP